MGFRSGSRAVVHAALVALLIAPPAPPQGSAPSSAPSSASLPVPRVGLIGASVSAGFADPRPRADGERNETVTLRHLLHAIWPRGSVEFRAREAAMLPMFMGPDQYGRQQLERVLKDRPDLVLGLDFPFWFGYGSARGEDARLARQQQGFELLDQVVASGCVLVIGDYPDMHGADPQMLPPGSIPDVATLARLNDQLRAWAKAKPNVHLFELAHWVQVMRSDGETIRTKHGPVQIPPLGLLQSDRLHATRLGMALLGMKLHELLVAKLPSGQPLRPGPLTLEQLIEHCGAGAELESFASRPARQQDPGASRPASRPASAPAASPADRGDGASIDSLVAALYDVISGPKGQARDFDRLRALFTAEARMGALATRDGRTAARMLTVEQYFERARPLFEREGFFEREVARRSERFGHLAHVFSTYESRHDAADAQPFVRGINSIQLVHDGTRWWIASLLWEAESRDLPLPAEYLPKGK